MRKQADVPHQTALLIVVGITATLYLLFIFSQALWKSQKKEVLFAQLQQENEILEKENEVLAEHYRLQKTPQYLDKYAKTNLGKLNSGEKVMILPPPNLSVNENFENLSLTEMEVRIVQNKSIRQQWWHIFFEK